MTSTNADTQHNEMAGFALTEVPLSVLPALHPERAGQDALQHLPKREWFGLLFVVHGCPGMADSPEV